MVTATICVLCNICPARPLYTLERPKVKVPSIIITWRHFGCKMFLFLKKSKRIVPASGSSIVCSRCILLLLLWICTVVAPATPAFALRFISVCFESAALSQYHSVGQSIIVSDVTGLGLRVHESHLWLSSQQLGRRSRGITDLALFPFEQALLSALLYFLFFTFSFYFLCFKTFSLEREPVFNRLNFCRYLVAVFFLTVYKPATKIKDRDRTVITNPQRTIIKSSKVLFLLQSSFVALNQRYSQLRHNLFSFTSMLSWPGCVRNSRSVAALSAKTATPANSESNSCWETDHPSIRSATFKEVIDNQDLLPTF